LVGGRNAAARTRLATLANNWPRTCVIVSLSFTRLLGTFDVPEPLALVLFDYANLGIVCAEFDGLNTA
jgi:hypothetical protein